MTQPDPITELDPRYSQPDASPTPWPVARRQLETSMVYWLSTVRPDGRPHVTTIAGVWMDGALHFTTGTDERKARNVAANRHIVVTTGSSAFEGLDVVIEGEAIPVTDPATLARLAAAYPSKYGDVFRFHVSGGVLYNDETDDTEVLAFGVRPVTGFGFGKSPFSQTRWRF